MLLPWRKSSTMIHFYSHCNQCWWLLDNVYGIYYSSCQILCKLKTKQTTKRHGLYYICWYFIVSPMLCCCFSWQKYRENSFNVASVAKWVFNVPVTATPLITCYIHCVYNLIFRFIKYPVQALPFLTWLARATSLDLAPCLIQTPPLTTMLVHPS
jgi:hypothetical protein